MLSPQPGLMTGNQPDPGLPAPCPGPGRPALGIAACRSGRTCMRPGRMLLPW